MGLAESSEMHRESRDSQKERIMKRITRAAVTAAAVCGLALGGGTAVVGQADAAPKPQAFPHIYGAAKLPPEVLGEDHPGSDVVWDHWTVLTRSQTKLVRDNRGALSVVTGTRIPPYAGMAQLMGDLTTSEYGRDAIGQGGCLVVFWNDRQINIPGIGPAQVAGYFADRAGCRP